MLCPKNNFMIVNQHDKRAWSGTCMKPWQLYTNANVRHMLLPRLLPWWTLTLSINPTLTLIWILTLPRTHETQWLPSVLLCVNQELNNDYSGTGAIMLAQRLQAKPEHARKSPTMRSSARQRGGGEAASFFTYLPRHRRVCDVGYGEREFQSPKLSASPSAYCVSLDHDVSKFNPEHLYFPLSMPYVTETLQYREIFLTKWQPPIWLGYRKAGVLHAAPDSVLAVRWDKHDFTLKTAQLLVLLLINTTTLQRSVFPSPLSSLPVPKTQSLSSLSTLCCRRYHSAASTLLPEQMSDHHQCTSVMIC